MEIVKAIILGLIQGVTEWLPVSSTGHMLLFDAIWPLRVSENCRNLFMVVVQLGSILAVIVLYFKTLWPFAKERKERHDTFVLWGKVLVASIPAGIIGVALDDVVSSVLSSWFVIAIALFVYGILFIVLEKCFVRKARVNSISELSIKDALLMGFFQLLAIVPGTSRSGSTILGGIVIGLSRPVAAEFSFFMAIPAMAGASLVRLFKCGFALTGSEWMLIFVGSMVAFLVSLVAIKALVAYVRGHDFSAFGVYRIILSLIVVLYFTLR